MMYGCAVTIGVCTMIYGVRENERDFSQMTEIRQFDDYANEVKRGELVFGLGLATTAGATAGFSALALSERKRKQKP